jgi:hypothetical protein
VKASLLAAALAAGISSSPAWADEAATQDFTLVNGTGGEITNLFISETSKDDWEEDVLGDEVLAAGEEVEVKFEGHDSCYWDIKAQENDVAVFWRKVNLCEVSTVTLHCDDSKCYATYK